MGLIWFEPALLLFTLGYMLQHAGTFILVKRIKELRSVAGLSLDTQVLYLIGALTKFTWISSSRLIKFPLVWIELGISVVQGFYLLFLFYKFKYTLCEIKPRIGLKSLLIICTMAAFFFQQDKKEFTYPFLVNLTLFLESTAMIPQISIFKQMTERTEYRLGLFIFLFGLSRVVRLFCWIIMFFENEGFFLLVLADILHTIILSDYMYMYLKGGQDFLPL